MHEGWKICIASCLWSLWLSRNLLSFEGVRTSKEELSFLIKHRAFKWSAAVRLIEDNMNPIWEINPISVIVNHNGRVMRSLWSQNYDLIGFTDGAFSRESFNKCKARIGGYLKDKDDNIVFIFSGPSNASSPLLAELEAISHLLLGIVNSNKRLCWCKVYSDCFEAVRSCSKLKVFGVSDGLWAVEHMIKQVNSLKVDFGLISRNLNVGADDLAKQGMHRNKLIEGWW